MKKSLECKDTAIFNKGLQILTINCNSCHAIGPRKAFAVFEAQGIDLLIAAKRLRPGFYHRWMLDPMRIEPATKMPKYTDPQGMSQLTDALGGDGSRQFEAIRHYLLFTAWPQIPDPNE